MNFADMAAKAKKGGAAEAPKASKSKLETHNLKDAPIAMAARIDATIKSLKALLETHKGEVVDAAISYWLSVGLKAGSQPKNFRAEDEDCKATMELKKRTVASILTDDEAKLLEEYGVPYETKVITPAGIQMNPEYLDGSEASNAVLNRLSEIVAAANESGRVAMKKAKTPAQRAEAAAMMLPEDMFLPVAERTVRVIGKEALDKVFKLPEYRARAVLRIVFTPATKFSGATLTEANMLPIIAMAVKTAKPDDEEPE